MPWTMIEIAMVGVSAVRRQASEPTRRRAHFSHAEQSRMHRERSDEQEEHGDEPELPETQIGRGKRRARWSNAMRPRCAVSRSEATGFGNH